MRWLTPILLLIFAGCSGYRYTQQDNPLAQYGIHSLSVPMFYNYTNMPEVSAEFTRETYRLLTGFSGLKLKSGYSRRSDAVLLGVLRSRERVIDSNRPLNFRVAKDQARTSVGPTREDFYVPGTNDMEIFLQVIVIKKPTEEELSLLRSGIGSQIKSTSRIIFNVLLPLRAQYPREILDGPGTAVVATHNSGIQRRAVRSLAESAAISIRDMIFYAF